MGIHHPLRRHQERGLPVGTRSGIRHPRCHHRRQRRRIRARRLAKLIDRARRGDGPSILECKTYRRDGHFITDPQKYRSQEEVEEWKLYNDPIDRFRRKILLEGVVAQDDLDAAEERLDQEFAQALEFAVNSPFPKAEDALDDVFSDEVNLYE